MKNHTRAEWMLRLSPLLLLTAALAVMAVFLVNQNARPASADHTGAGTVWSATLTVGQYSFGRGYSLASPTGPAGTLSNTAFTYDGVDQNVVALFIKNDGDLQLNITTVPASLKSDLALQVGNAHLLLSGTTNVGTSALRWTNPGLSWSVGETVQLKLVDAKLNVSFSPDKPLREDWETNSAHDLWSPNLTVRVLSPSTDTAPAIVGCDDSQAGVSCSSALTDTDFTFRGVAYTVRGISYNQRKVTQDPNNPFNIIEHRETLKLTLDKAIPESIRSCLALHSGNAKVPFADDGLPGAGVDTALSTSNGVANSTLTVTAIGALNAGDLGWGLNWSADQTVKPRLPNIGCLTLTLSEAVSETTSLQWRRGGTSDSSDYQHIKLPTFAAGSTTAHTPIRPVDDSEAEGCETIVLDMTMWPGTTKAVHQKFTVAIQDDDGGNRCVGGG